MLPSQQSRGTPTYDLERIQQLVGQGPLTSVVTTAALDGAHECGWDQSRVIEAVLMLRPSDFYKTMEAEKRPGMWQDVYHLRIESVDLYVKLQIDFDGCATVVQFKRR